jgi:DNA-binding PadR family transcriptional regulator
VARRSDGVWKPSPGSVYPILQQLQDEGLVVADPADPKQFTLTDTGRGYVEEEYGDTPPPWETLDGDSDREKRHQFRRQLGALAMTYQQIELTGGPDDVRRAGDVLEKARRDLLAILAQDLREPSGS